MKLLIELDDVFAVHYKMDKFKDSLSRITCDIARSNPAQLSGRFEWELAKELVKAFEKSSPCLGDTDEEQIEEYSRLFDSFTELTERHERMTGERVDVLHRED